MSRFSAWVEPSRCDYPSQQELRDRQDEREGERYVQLLCKRAEEIEAAYEEEFGEAYRFKHPLKIDYMRLHEEVMKQLREEK